MRLLSLMSRDEVVLSCPFCALPFHWFLCDS
uniref:Uncharacterized protein n=1 Tax=Arundo donax TaxID=35708 RepID=A0A0A9GGW0_ARUDO